jgi:hypothetical protein
MLIELLREPGEIGSRTRQNPNQALRNPSQTQQNPNRTQRNPNGLSGRGLSIFNRLSSIQALLTRRSFVAFSLAESVRESDSTNSDFPEAIAALKALAVAWRLPEGVGHDRPAERAARDDDRPVREAT